MTPEIMKQWHVVLAGRDVEPGFAKMGETILARRPGTSRWTTACFDIGAGRIAHMDADRHRHADPLAHLAGRAGV